MPMLDQTLKSRTGTTTTTPGVRPPSSMSTAAYKHFGDKEIINLEDSIDDSDDNEFNFEAYKQKHFPQAVDNKKTTLKRSFSARSAGVTTSTTSEAKSRDIGAAGSLGKQVATSSTAQTSPTEGASGSRLSQHISSLRASERLKKHQTMPASLSSAATTSTTFASRDFLNALTSKSETQTSSLTGTSHAPSSNAAFTTSSTFAGKIPTFPSRASSSDSSSDEEPEDKARFQNGLNARAHRRALEYKLESIREHYKIAGATPEELDMIDLEDPEEMELLKELRAYSDGSGELGIYWDRYLERKREEEERENGDGSEVEPDDHAYVDRRSPGEDEMESAMERASLEESLFAPRARAKSNPSSLQPVPSVSHAIKDYSVPVRSGFASSTTYGTSHYSSNHLRKESNEIQTHSSRSGSRAGTRKDEAALYDDKDDDEDVPLPKGSRFANLPINDTIQLRQMHILSQQAGTRPTSSRSASKTDLGLDTKAVDPDEVIEHVYAPLRSTSKARSKRVMTTGLSPVDPPVETIPVSSKMSSSSRFPPTEAAASDRDERERAARIQREKKKEDQQKRNGQTSTASSTAVRATRTPGQVNAGSRSTGKKREEAPIVAPKGPPARAEPGEYPATYASSRQYPATSQAQYPPPTPDEFFYENPSSSSTEEVQHQYPQHADYQYNAFSQPELRQSRQDDMGTARPLIHPGTIPRAHSTGLDSQSSLGDIPQSSSNLQTVLVNRREYYRFDLIGRGGSSRVYRVLRKADNKLLALKRVALTDVDANTMRSYMDEIALLKRLEGSKHVIQLIDNELRGKPGSGTILVVMELGETDFARLLADRQGQPLFPPWIVVYWKQMLDAVHHIHEEKIVHSDLKPANFVLVKGVLKLIDFGIAKAIANDTTNIQRDENVGTPNYMSPEAIDSPLAGTRQKLGRSSDVWSLGCIFYQMVYGGAPFANLANFQKVRAITDPNYQILFPDYSPPPLVGENGELEPILPSAVKVPPIFISTMQRCLTRDPKQRPTIPELRSEEWVNTVLPSLDDVDEETELAGNQMEQFTQVVSKFEKKLDRMRDSHTKETVKFHLKPLIQSLQQKIRQLDTILSTVHPLQENEAIISDAHMVQLLNWSYVQASPGWDTTLEGNKEFVDDLVQQILPDLRNQHNVEHVALDDGILKLLE